MSTPNSNKQEQTTEDNSVVYVKLPESPMYFIGNNGTWLNLKFCKIMGLQKPKSSNMYHNIRLPNQGIMLFHRAVASLFVANPENYPHINHIDGDRSNNHFKNLEWCTRSQNMFHWRKLRGSV
jgi:hypothetical protein